MANKPIEMQQLKAVLRLHVKGRSIRSISEGLALSRNTVRKYIRAYQASKCTWEELSARSDIELAKLFTEQQPKVVDVKLRQLEEFFPYMYKELRKAGVTKYLLWQEYLSRYPNGYRSSQFMDYYLRWVKRSEPTMHIQYKAGDKTLVDYAGKKLQIVDPQTGEIREAEVFVSILGASQLIYVEATATQQKADFIASVERCFGYYGGVTQAVVTDNLKSAVTHSHRFEPVLNPDFRDFALHYDVTVLPARVYRPKDKALVEGAVRIVYQQIHAQLRKQTFHSLDELNAAIAPLLEELNMRKLSGRPYSRRELFETTERSHLQALPAEPFELRTYAQATVLQNSHVMLSEDKHYYSVPFRYIRKKVKLAYTNKLVEIYYNYERIAEHPRVRSRYNYSTISEHMASTHRHYTKWNAEFFLQWARNLDPDVEQLIMKVLDKRQHPEQAYRVCMGILSLNKKVGQQRLVAAARLALSFGRYSYRMIADILEKGLDKLPPEEANPQALPEHENIRGQGYYQSPKSMNDE